MSCYVCVRLLKSSFDINAHEHRYAEWYPFHSCAKISRYENVDTLQIEPF